MPTVPVKGGELYYESHGEKYPLILISGLSGAAGAWKAQLAAFSQHFKAIIHDHRGSGRSTRQYTDPLTVQTFADDVIALMDGLKIDRAHVVGHSTGGAIAQSLTIDHPDRVDRLGLVSTFSHSDTYNKLGSQMRLMLLNQIGPEAYLKATPFLIYPNWWINAHPEFVENYAEFAMPNFPGAALMTSKINAIRSFDRRADLGRIRSRTLVVCADNDVLAPPYFSEELAQRIPNARLKIISGAGHTCKQTKPEEFNRIILDFLLEP